MGQGESQVGITLPARRGEPEPDLASNVHVQRPAKKVGVERASTQVESGGGVYANDRVRQGEAAFSDRDYYVTLLRVRINRLDVNLAERTGAQYGLAGLLDRLLVQGVARSKGKLTADDTLAGDVVAFYPDPSNDRCREKEGTYNSTELPRIQLGNHRLQRHLLGNLYGGGKHQEG
ncbi:hypothetical protein ES703_80156 [subsurface metagenome]